jgi:hypothetical protein
MIRFLIAALLVLLASRAFAADPTVFPSYNTSAANGSVIGAVTMGLDGNSRAVPCGSSTIVSGCGIGGVGANTTLTVAQTVTASSAYASGNAVGGLITLAGINRATGASILVQSVLVTSKSAQTNPMDLLLFNANPTGSTCTDKTAVSIVAADAGKLVGVAHVTDWTSGGTASVGQMQQPPMGIAVPATTLYACLVTRGTPTWTATSDVSVVVSSILN